MTSEAKRGCGFRKVGGIYLVGEGISLGCDLLPFNVETCPCCSAGIKYSRGWKWIVPKQLFNLDGTIKEDMSCTGCPMKISKSGCPMQSEKKAGLLWVGHRFYSPESFIQEAQEMGISKRIGAVPREFELGKTWVFLAHIQAGTKNNIKVPAVFYVFRPTKIEKIVTENQSKNAPEMQKLIKKGITPVVVPDNDKDHQGNVYEDQRAHQKSLFED